MLLFPLIRLTTRGKGHSTGMPPLLQREGHLAVCCLADDGRYPATQANAEQDLQWMVFVLAKIYVLKVNQGTERELSGSGVLCKHEDPSLMPRIHVKMVGTVVSMCNPSVGKADIDRSLGFSGQPV